MTGLICAASNGHYEITKLLIEKGANLEAVQDVSGSIPVTSTIHELYLWRHFSFVCLLSWHL